MKDRFKTEDHIIMAFKKGGQNAREAMAYLFRDKILFKRVLNYILYKGGSSQDAKDVLVESLIILERNIRKNVFQGTSSLNTYIMGIARFCWIQNCRSKGVKVVGDELLAMDIPEIGNPELVFVNEELKENLNTILDLIGEKCKAIMKLWSMNLNFEEIREALEMSSVSAVRKQKFYCKEKMVELVKERPYLFPEYSNG